MKYFPILAALVLLFACKKDNKDTTRFNGTYEDDLSLYYDAAVLYTANGLITDASVVKGFVNKIYGKVDAVYYLKSLDGAGKIDKGSDFKIKLEIADNKVIYSQLDADDQLGYTETKKLVAQNSQTAFMVNSLLSPVGADDGSEIRCGNNARLFRKYPPAISCDSVNCWGYEQIPLTLHDGYITLPYFNYSLEKHMSNTEDGDFICWSSVSNTYDEFDESITKKMVAGDTLLICRFYRMLTKK